MTKVTIYSTTTCPYCKMLKDYLTQKGISFEEKLVDLDEKNQKEMSDISGGFMGVPFTVLVDENGKKDAVIGFDKNKFDELLGI